MKEVRQIGTRTVTFSDNVSRAGGIVTTPAWAWSEDYRKDHARSFRNPPDDRYKQAARAAAYDAGPKMGGPTARPTRPPR